MQLAVFCSLMLRLVSISGSLLSDRPRLLSKFLTYGNISDIIMDSRESRTAAEGLFQLKLIKLKLIKLKLIKPKLLKLKLIELKLLCTAKIPTDIYLLSDRGALR